MWWYCLLFLVAALAFDHQVEGSARPVGLARSAHIHTRNLLGEMDRTGLDVFATTLPDSCIITKSSPKSARKFVPYKNTEALYSTLTNAFNLGASLQKDYTLSYTLDTITKSIAGISRTVSGTSLLIMQGSSKLMIDENCLYSEKLAEALMNDFEDLPADIYEPWLSTSWSAYDVFLKKYGSHIMVSATLGASIDQMAFADTSNSYSERDFHVKSCASFFGPTEVSLVSTDLCANVSTEEVRKVETMKMTQTLTVTGGSKFTRDQLLQGKRSAELVEMFLGEPGDVDSPIGYTYMSIWDFLQTRFAGLTSLLSRAVNLEYYYLGYLNYGCPYTHHAGIDLQTFNYTAHSTPQTPQYECTLAPDGCRSYQDCHYQLGVWCSCNGDTCIRYTDTKLDTGVIKKTAAPNYESWSWEGCGWKTWGSDCSCYNKNHERLKVWSLGNKNALYAAHYRLAIKPSAKKQEL